ncbi:hypothetical protein E4P39_01630 [Blastococcus sp. CT_GayMR19]|uniref:hypothetical protein n=1 Tax=Blastococcus sp. CT_GayMR19 TaxID=2559608 RepID=UPI00107462DD|nr:hypothetical protein [Blastococcus sp. CT_GayMR19]TFV79370.1 hypothetical protein E4P39_01630 [Blastococcus sp. CT_GayMR19]
MTDPNPAPDLDRDLDGGTPPGMPRWVKVSAIVVGVLILVFLVLQLTGIAGDHGPGRHSSAGLTPPAGVTESAVSVDALA